MATDPQLSCLTALTHLTSLTLGSLLVYKSQVKAPAHVRRTLPPYG